MIGPPRSVNRRPLRFPCSTGGNSVNRGFGRGFGPVFGRTSPGKSLVFGKAFVTGRECVWSARRLWFGLTKPEEPQAAHHRTGRGEAGADEQGQGGAAADAARTCVGQREDQADERRTQGLPDEPRGGENAAGAAGAFARCARKDGAVGGIGRSRTRCRKPPSTRRLAIPLRALPGRPPEQVQGSIRPNQSRRECRPDSAGRQAIPRWVP